MEVSEELQVREEGVRGNWSEMSKAEDPTAADVGLQSARRRSLDFFFQGSQGFESVYNIFQSVTVGN